MAAALAFFTDKTRRAATWNEDADEASWRMA